MCQRPCTTREQTCVNVPGRAAHRVHVYRDLQKVFSMIPIKCLSMTAKQKRNMSKEKYVVILQLHLIIQHFLINKNQRATRKPLTACHSITHNLQQHYEYCSTTSDYILRSSGIRSGVFKYVASKWCRRMNLTEQSGKMGNNNKDKKER
jgi:hypothetical protein